jgi:hypothetical protein
VYAVAAACMNSFDACCALHQSPPRMGSHGELRLEGEYVICIINLSCSICRMMHAIRMRVPMLPPIQHRRTGSQVSLPCRLYGLTCCTPKADALDRRGWFDVLPWRQAAFNSLQSMATVLARKTRMYLLWRS